MVWMLGLSETVVFLLSGLALVYGIYMISAKRPPLYFQLIVASVACHVLGCLFDVCLYFVTGSPSGDYLIGYFGTMGCFLFFLTTSFSYMDGILDDKTPHMKKARALAWIAPAFLAVLLIPNFFANIPNATKIIYAILWIPALLSSYFNLKHAIIPDMDFGFAKAIKPYNIAALSFTVLQLIHLTLWSFCSGLPLLISGILLGLSCLAMIVTADRGIQRWVI